MKALTIRFDDSVDISHLPPGTAVTVGDGTTSLSGHIMIGGMNIEELPNGIPEDVIRHGDSIILAGHITEPPTP